MRLSILQALCALAGVLTASPALAAGTAAVSVTSTSTLIAVNDFDIVRDCPPARPLAATSGAVDKPDRVFIAGAGPVFESSEQLAPHFVYQRGVNGPVFEFAALGGGAKDRPGLAHLAFGWNF